MKNSFFRFCLLVCISLFSVACSRSDKLSGNEFLIEGRLSGVEDGVVINLQRLDGNAGMTIASDTIRNGRFVFKEKTESESEQMTIIPRGEDFLPMSLDVWVAPGVKIKINGKGKLHPVWEVKSSIPFQKEENRYTNKSRNFIVERLCLSVERDDLWKKASAASSEDETRAYRKTADSLEVITKSLRIKELYANMDIMEKTNVSPIWLDKMRHITQMLKYGDLSAENDSELRNKAEALYGRMSEEDKNSQLGYIITAQLFPPVIVGIGEDMADADFFDINGNTKHISDYLGKYLLLDFWGSGCGPCIAAFPEIKEIWETCIEKLTIISISLDTETKWKETMPKHDMPWINIRDSRTLGELGLATKYGARGIPFYIIISPEGKVVDKWIGYVKGSLKRKVSENIK